MCRRVQEYLRALTGTYTSYTDLICENYPGEYKYIPSYYYHSCCVLLGMRVYRITIVNPPTFRVYLLTLPPQDQLFDYNN